MSFFDPVSLALGAGMSLFGAVTSASAADSNNNALAEQGANATTAAGLNAEQLVAQRKLDRLKKNNERGQIVGRIRVAAAENGVGSGGSTAALERQALINESIDNQTADLNLKNQLRGLSIGLQSNLISLNSQMQSPLLAGIGGGLTGFTTGLQIGNTINAANAIPEPKKAMPGVVKKTVPTVGAPQTGEYQ
jgi:hypothetical protein